MPKLTTGELVTVIEQLHSTLDQEKQNRARQLIAQLDHEEERNYHTSRDPAQQLLDWQAAILTLDQFIKDNVTEEHYQYITTNIVQQRSLDQCLHILTAARDILAPEVQNIVNQLVHNIGAARYQLSHPENLDESVSLENTREVYLADLITLKNLTSRVIIATSE